MFSWAYMRWLTVAILVEVGLYGLAAGLPGIPDWFVVFTPALLPGVTLQFLVGGGMSMFDGVSPEWRIQLGFALGFSLNLVVMYLTCLFASKLYREICPVLSWRRGDGGA
jgi:hypothetical protein